MECGGRWTPRRACRTSWLARTAVGRARPCTLRRSVVRATGLQRSPLRQRRTRVRTARTLRDDHLMMCESVTADRAPARQCGERGANARHACTDVCCHCLGCLKSVQSRTDFTQTGSVRRSSHTPLHEQLAHNSELGSRPALVRFTRRSSVTVTPRPQGTRACSISSIRSYSHRVRSTSGL